MPPRLKRRSIAIAVVGLLACSPSERDVGSPPLPTTSSRVAVEPAPAMTTAEPSPEVVPEPIPPSRTADLSKVQEWDVVFQTSRSSQSRAIQAATKSALSHMGVVVGDGQALAVYEA